MNCTVCPECPDQFIVDFTGQAAHALFGAFVVMMLGIMAGKCSSVYAFVSVMVFASIKEFVWDNARENAVTRGSDLEDFGFYALGSAVGILINLFLPGSMDPRVACFCARKYAPLDSSDEMQNHGLCLWS